MAIIQKRVELLEELELKKVIEKRDEEYSNDRDIMLSRIVSYEHENKKMQVNYKIRIEKLEVESIQLNRGSFLERKIEELEKNKKSQQETI